MLTLAQALRLYPLPRLECRMLLQHVIPGLTHAYLLAHPEQSLSHEQAHFFQQLVQRRLNGEPIAYLLGESEFYGRSFRLSPAVLIPRPETEHLLEAALLHTTKPGSRVLDLGTGSGVLAVSLALEAPHCQVMAVDLSAEALQVAQANARGLGAKVAFYQGSWYQALPEQFEFDLIMSNPPYIRHDDHHLTLGDLRYEPSMALTDGADGLVCLRQIIAGAPAHLSIGGWLMLEHGYDQGSAVRQLFAATQWGSVQTLVDLAGLDRVTIARKEN
ncbi:peptide chain release factor N(5)-glutamine methyltransferase [Neisseriaceae bacterium TC5R-5]|nr:peptide chain release factor N(5)-glutamine methyltransferase [Neisseriaceae bacterium TC5R-5]